MDGGQSQVGIESTVLDLSVSPPKHFAPGHDPLEVARGGGRTTFNSRTARNPPSTLRSPGLLEKHYSPKAKLVVLELEQRIGVETKIHQSKFGIERCCIIAHTKIPGGFEAAKVSVIPHDAEAFARALYAELHRCDAAGAGLIIVESPPELPEWAGIADRLRRAAA